MVYVTQIEKHKSSIRQANDFKRALRGRQPTSFIAFILFVLFCVILICFVGICPNMMRKREIFFEVVDHKPNPPKPKNSTSLARPVPMEARPVPMEARPVPMEARPCHYIPKIYIYIYIIFSPSFNQNKLLSSSTSLSKPP